MDAFNLKTASIYVNNLLLARGLLRDGKPIEFAHPSRGEGGKEATMAHIINLVHDLILKRDRDQEHRESLASTLRSVRSEASRQTVALEKLQTRNDDLSRQLSLAQSQERSARAALRTADSSARTLREEMLRLKTTVQQVRTSCANDIRKRDVQIQRLKSHLTAQQRGNKTGLVGASITITPGAIGMNGAGYGSKDDDVPSLNDPDYSLKQETTEFLTQLSQSLSDENDNLIGLVRSTLSTLKQVQGIPEGQTAEDDELSMIQEEETADGMLHALPTSYEALATDMDAVLENLKTLLTNPNFVPIDEVEMREEEISRLRAGWEKMEARWREAVTLMEGWRKRMASGGNTINLDDLNVGLGLGAGLEPVNKSDESLVTVEEEEEEEEEAGDLEDAVDEAELEDPPSLEPDDIPEKTSNSDMFKLKLQPDQQALREGNGNIRSPRKVVFAPSANNTPSKDADENASEVDLVDGAKVLSPTKSEISRSRPRTLDSQSPRKTQKRLSTSPHPEEPSPKLTVEAKLKAAQAEAEAIAVAEGLRAVKAVAETREGNEEGQVHRRRSSPRKTRIGGRPKRRKSTLTPEELDNLLGI